MAVSSQDRAYKHYTSNLIHTSLVKGTAHTRTKGVMGKPVITSATFNVGCLIKKKEQKYEKLTI